MFWIGVTLNPKERASFARIQTADWEAFRRFGDGLRLFDDADYDRSLEALRDATARDQEFGLARTTLIAKMQKLGITRIQA